MQTLISHDNRPIKGDIKIKAELKGDNLMTSTMIYSFQVF